MIPFKNIIYRNCPIYQKPVLYQMNISSTVQYAATPSLSLTVAVWNRVGQISAIIGRTTHFLALTVPLILKVLYTVALPQRSFSQSINLFVAFLSKISGNQSYTCIELWNKVIIMKIKQLNNKEINNHKIYLNHKSNRE